MDPDIRRMRARQVGMLMQAYRRSHVVEGSRRGLSQEGLLELMGLVDPKYLERYDRSTVSRWESGEILPNAERLWVFGEALDLSAAEIDGLVSLAGLGWDETSLRSSEVKMAVAPDHAGRASAESPRKVDASSDRDEESPYTRYIMRYALSRFLLPAMCVGAAGYLLAVFGWNSTMALGACAVVAMCFVAGRSLIRYRGEGALHELFFATVFFMLSTALIHTPLTNLDPYGFYAIGNYVGTSVPFMLTLMVNLLVATTASLVFDFLWRWQYASSHGEKSPYNRAAWIVLPPVGLTYLVQLMFSDVGAWIAGLAVFTVVAGVFIAMVVLRDEEVSVGELDRKILLWAAVMVTIVISGLGVVAALVTYAQPNLVSVTERGLFYSWSLDFGYLGYPEAELVDRFRVGVLWISIVSIIYMVVVLGGSLIVTIYHLDAGDSASLAGAAVATGDGVQVRRRSSIRTHLDIRYWWKKVVGQRLVQGGRRRPEPSS